MNAAIADSRFLQGLPTPDGINELSHDVLEKIQCIAPIYEGHYTMDADTLTKQIQAMDYLMSGRMRELLVLASSVPSVGSALFTSQNNMFNDNVKNEYRQLSSHNNSTISYTINKINVSYELPRIILLIIQYDLLPLFEWKMGALMSTEEDKCQHMKNIFMIVACKYGSANIVQFLIRQGVIIGHNDVSIAFITACINGRVSMVQYFIETHLDILKSHRYIGKGIYNAVQHGHLEILKYVVSKGFDIHIENELMFRTACTRGYLPIVQYLVEQCCANIHIRHNAGVMDAMTYGHLEVVKYLMSKGAIVHHRDEDWGTVNPFPHICGKGDLPMVQYLVEQCGMDIHMNGDEALKRACKDGRVEVVKYLVSKGATISQNMETSLQIIADIQNIFATM